MEDIYGLGTDVSTFVDGDLDPGLNLIRGPRVVGEALARRLLTPLGTLVGDETYGYDLRAHLDEDLDATDLRLIAGACRVQCEADERVQSVDIRVSLVDETLTAAVSFDLRAGGTFRFTLAVTAVTATFLFGDAA